MTTITRFTKEKLIKRLKEKMSSARYALGFVQNSEILRDIEMDLRLAEIARASLTAEPIGAFHISDQQVEGTSDYIKDGEWPIDNGVIEVYAASPAPVPMKEHQIRELVNELRDIAVKYHSTQQLRERIARTVRTAMLQGRQPVSNRDELLPGIKPAPELDSVAKNADSMPGNSPVIPDGYVVVPKRLTAENGAKFLLVGEFSETKFINCTECFGDAECETCDGSGRIEISVPVSWTNIKAIWAKGVEHFAAAPKQETL